MPKLEEVYRRMEKNKARRREISKMLKDELDQSERYTQVKDEMATLREEKKSIEQNVKAGSPEYIELDDIKIDLQTDQEVLADIALNMYMKDETVEIIDEYDQTWYPVFKVSFKKSN